MIRFNITSQYMMNLKIRDEFKNGLMINVLLSL